MILTSFDKTDINRSTSKISEKSLHKKKKKKKEKEEKM